MALSLFYLLIAMLSIQYGASLAKQLFPLLGAAGTTSLRTFFAAVILLAIWRPWRQRVTRENFFAVVGYGVALGLMNLCFYMALEKIPLGVAVTLEFTGPLTVALLSSKKPLDLVWALLAGLGIWLILPKSNSAESLELSGILFALGAGFFWALYIVLGQRAGRNVHSGFASSLGMGFAALSVMPFGIFRNSTELTNTSLWPMALLVAILSSALPYSCEMLALKKIPAKTFGILMSVEPVIAAIMGFFFLHESLNSLQWIAIACVIAASVGSTSTVNTQ